MSATEFALTFSEVVVLLCDIDQRRAHCREMLATPYILDETRTIYMERDAAAERVYKTLSDALRIDGATIKVTQ